MFGFVKKKDYDLLKECIKNKEYMLHGTQLMLKEQKSKQNWSTNVRNIGKHCIQIQNEMSREI